MHSWLVLPEPPTEAPLPLAVFIHGGPISSWAGWHWRWCPSLVAARGWAVLLPNPRLRPAMARTMSAAAWSDWATLPAGDILAAVDVAVARDDIDAERIAAIGGSYGGYMANWLAVTTDRFRAIVTHASVWDLELERNTSDAGFLMDREFGEPRADEDVVAASSHPMCAPTRCTHPCWSSTGRAISACPWATATASGRRCRCAACRLGFLVYPDENHWILKPQNARLWYQTVLAFLDEHVLGKPWARPPLV